MLGNSIFARPSVISENPGGGSPCCSPSSDIVELLEHLPTHILKGYTAADRMTLDPDCFLPQSLEKGTIIVTVRHMGGSVI